MSKKRLISERPVMQTTSFRVSGDDIKAIGEISRRYGVTRSEAIRQAISLLQKEYRGLNDESDKRKG